METITVNRAPEDKRPPVEFINGVRITKRNTIQIALPYEFQEIDLEFQRICARCGYDDLKIIRYRIKEWVDKMKEIEPILEPE